MLAGVAPSAGMVAAAATVWWRAGKGEPGNKGSYKEGYFGGLPAEQVRGGRQQVGGDRGDNEYGRGGHMRGPSKTELGRVIRGGGR